MFEKKVEGALWAVSIDAAACVVNGKLRWFRSLGESSRVALEFDLPKGWGVGDVAVLHPSAVGLTAVCRDGRMAFYDLNRREWASFGNALTAGIAP